MADAVYEGRDLEVLANMPNYYSWIMDTFAPYVTGHVVEYGAGAGTISTRLAPLANKLTLVEPSPNLVQILQHRFRDQPQVEIIGTSLEDHVAQLGDNSTDTIVLVNVLEHIEDDRGALLHLVRALKPSGKLLVFVPALQVLMSRLDRMHGHFRRYHRGELIAKVRGAGADISVCRYFDLAGVLPWLVLNRLMGSTTFNPALIDVNDRFVVPVSRAIEQIVGLPFGKNLILVASKSAGHG
jgi:SAM-dependent methyltransferase